MRHLERDLMKLFSIVTLSLVFLLFVAAGLGGVWIAIALLYITAFTLLMDRLIAARPNSPENSAEFPASHTLSALLGWVHFILLAVLLWRVAGPNDLGGLERGGLFVAFGLFFGQVSHANAHELIHRNGRGYRRLGRQIYSSLLVGHHVSAHCLVHHVHAGTKFDPNSAKLGLGFYRFAQKAWIGAFRAGLRAETKRLVAADKYAWQHPYFEYAATAFSTLVIAYALAGIGGCLVLVAIAIYTQIQILLSDYVQHYGLRRGQLADGKFEPVGPQHAWNSPHAFSSALMFNAPRHSDHHINPARVYSALHLDPQTMPILPHSLPVMAVLALWPPLWRRIMDPLCATWRPGWERQTPPTLGRAKIRALGDMSPTGLRPAHEASLHSGNLPESTYENANPAVPIADSNRTSARQPKHGRGRI